MSFDPSTLEITHQSCLHIMRYRQNQLLTSAVGLPLPILSIHWRQSGSLSIRHGGICKTLCLCTLAVRHGRQRSVTNLYAFQVNKCRY